MNLSNCNRYVYLYPKLCVTHYPLPLLPYLEHYQIIDTLELRHQMPLHLQCPCILRCLRWHPQREPKQQFHHRSHGPRSLLLLWIPNHSQKNPQRNVLPPNRHVHQGSKRENASAPCHRNSTMHPMQSQLGSHMVHLHQCQFCQMYD